jgi:hypothetical protein
VGGTIIDFDFTSADFDALVAAFHGFGVTDGYGGTTKDFDDVGGFSGCGTLVFPNDNSPGGYADAAALLECANTEVDLFNAGAAVESGGKLSIAGAAADDAATVAGTNSDLGDFSFSGKITVPAGGFGIAKTAPIQVTTGQNSATNHRILIQVSGSDVQLYLCAATIVTPPQSNNTFYNPAGASYTPGTILEWTISRTGTNYNVTVVQL